MRDVNSLVEHIKTDSGFDGDTTSYLDILCAKEDSELLRRVSHTKVLRQDFDEKRSEWRKQRKSIISAIGAMTARALKFENKERKAVALYALEYYKNIMGRDDGAILGESESTDSLVEQYQRHRDEISKIPMYADNIVKMLNNIRKTVRAYAKFQPGSNAFAQFLDEWWSSVVEFLQQSSIVDAEKNAREVMETLKKLKGKQEDNKKKEMSRLLAKLDAQAGVAPPARRMSQLFLEAPDNPEETIAPSSTWTDDLQAARASRAITPPAVQGTKRQRASEESSCTENARGSAKDLSLYNTQLPTSRSTLSVCSEPRDSISVDGMANLTLDANSNPNSSSSTRRSRAYSVSFDCEGGASSRNSVMSTVSAVSSCWDEGSVSTAGTGATRSSVVSMINDGADMPASSGLPRCCSSEDGLDDDDDDDDDEDDHFEAADNLDLGAVDLCATGEDADGKITYGDTDDLRLPSSLRDQDRDELRLPPSVAQIHQINPNPTRKKNVEKARFSAALDFFRQEQQQKGVGRIILPRSPIRAGAFKTEKPKSEKPPLSCSSINTPANLKRHGKTPRAAGASPRGNPRGGFGTKRISRSRFSAERGKDVRSAAVYVKGSERTLSLYIPRPQKSRTPSARPSKTPSARSTRRPTAMGLSPAGGSCRFQRSAFFG